MELNSAVGTTFFFLRCESHCNLTAISLSLQKLVQRVKFYSFNRSGWCPPVSFQFYAVFSFHSLVFAIDAVNSDWTISQLSVSQRNGTKQVEFSYSTFFLWLFFLLPIFLVPFTNSFAFFSRNRNEFWFQHRKPSKRRCFCPRASVARRSFRAPRESIVLFPPPPYAINTATMPLCLTYLSSLWQRDAAKRMWLFLFI